MGFTLTDDQFLIHIYYWHLFGKFDMRQDCAIAKAKHQNINKNWIQGSKAPAIVTSSQSKEKALEVQSFMH